MPELPEVESARRVLADGALHRRIVVVDDHDDVGNLPADEALWRAKINPGRGVDTLRRVRIDRLGTALQAAMADAIARGGVHTGDVIGARAAGERCPRCGGAMVSGSVGGRTTWWCAKEKR